MISKISLILLLFVIFILIYFNFTDYIEINKLYPSGNNFIFTSWIYSYNDSCFNTYPISLYYSNLPVTFIYPETIVKYPNYLEYYLSVWNLCDYKNATLILSGTNMSSPLYYSISKDNGNYSQLNLIKINNNSLYEVTIPYDPNVTIYNIKVSIPINNSFYNYYSFGAGGYGNIRYNQLTFLFKNDYLKGYYADESSFSITEGKIIKELPILKGNSKGYYFNETNAISLRFSPKSKFWSLMQKALDAIVLGMLSVLIYDLLRIFYARHKKTRFFKYEFEIK